MPDYSFNLGDQVVDILTDFEGTVIDRRRLAETEVMVKPSAGCGRAFRMARWFSEDRLVRIS